MFRSNRSVCCTYLPQDRSGGFSALYKNDRLYYAGLASNLPRRLVQHLKDRHRGVWNKFSVYLVIEADHIKELELLVLRIVRPQGNRKVSIETLCGS